MANPLREGYKKRKRWCERGLENLGERERERYTRGNEREIAKEKEVRYVVRDSTRNT